MADRIEKISSGTTKVKARAEKALVSKGRLLITVFVVILAMVYAILGMGYLNQRQEQEELTAQISEVTQTIREIPQPPEGLEQQLAAAQASFTAEQNSFPTEINTTQLVNNILGLANTCGVNATPMATKPWAVEMVGKHSYPVLRLTLAVEGSFPQLSTFANELEEGEYTTLIIENLSATRDSEESEDEATQVTGSLELAIYGRSLSSD
jgi:Tfp pilus assembly protein PilO